MNPHKLQVKIGQHEFNSEGPEETVKEQFQLFLKAVSAAKTVSEPPDGQGKRSSNSDEGGLPAAVLNQAYHRDRNGIVSLTTLPSTENRNLDSILLLIFGFQALASLDTEPTTVVPSLGVFKPEHAITATQLMLGARESGLALDRFDRTLAGHENLVIRTGRKKGMKYRLTKPGKAHAEKLLRAMFGE